MGERPLFEDSTISGYINRGVRLSGHGGLKAASETLQWGPSPMLNGIKRLVLESDRGPGRVFNLVIQVLIVLSIINLSLDTLPNLDPRYGPWLRHFEEFFVLVFTIEYILRVLATSPRRKYVLSFFGMIDLLAIVPFYLGFGGQLVGVRVLRLLRVFRILKLARYNQAAQRFHIALKLAREELILYATLSLILLYLAAFGIYFFESEVQPQRFGSVFHCLWWAVVTFSTVGYGDAFPITVGGKLFTSVILLLGLGLVSVPAGIIAAALSRARQLEESPDKLAKMSQDSNLAK